MCCNFKGKYTWKVRDKTSLHFLFLEHILWKTCKSFLCLSEMYARLFKNERSLLSTWWPDVFLKEAWRAISERYTPWLIVAHLPGMCEDMSLCLKMPFSKLPFTKYVLQVEHVAGRKCVLLLLQGKVWLSFNSVGPGLVEQWADEQDMLEQQNSICLKIKVWITYLSE